MEIKLGLYVIAAGSYTLYQDDSRGQIYYRTRGGQKEAVIPLPKGNVQAFGQTSLPISPPLPSEALARYKQRRSAQK